MLRLALSTLAARKSGTFGALAAVGLAVILIVSCGILLQSSLQRPIAVERLHATSVVVEGPTTVTGSQGQGNINEVSLTERGRLPGSAAGRIRKIPGVEIVIADRSVYAVAIDTHGRLVKSRNGPLPVGHGWESAPLTPYVLTGGHSPIRQFDVVIDRRLASRADVRVGERLRILTTAGTAAFTVAGIVGTPRRQFLPEQAAIFFRSDVAARLAASGSRVDLLGIITRRGADPNRVAKAVREQLHGSGFRVLTGSKRGEAESLDEALSNADVVAGLTVFALLATFVAIFVAASTFSLSVQQRHRELALLRAIGSTPGQVRRLVAGEALVISLVALLLSLPLCVLAAYAEKGLFVRAGMIPAGLHIVVGWPPLVGGLGAAIITTQLAAFVSARRASKIRPTDALREATVQGRPLSRVRAAAGVVALAGGIVVVVLDARHVRQSDAPVAAMVLMVAAALLGPMLARPFAWLAGKPLAMFGSGPGVLAWANTRTNLRRAASVATPLMLAISIVSTVYVSKSIVHKETHAQTVERTSAAFVLQAREGRGLPTEVAAAARRLPGVADASGSIATSIVVGPKGADLRTVPARGVDRDSLAGVIKLGVVSGSLAQLRGDSLAVSVASAADWGWRLGERVHLWLGDGTPETLRVVAEYSRPLGFGEVVLPRSLVAQHVTQLLDDAVFVSGKSGVRPADLERTLQTLRLDDRNVQVVSRSAYEATVDSVDKKDAVVVYILLALIVAFCGLSLVNALSMAIGERIHEFAQLRLIGATKRQVRAMIRTETLVMIAYGLTTGSLIAAPGLALLNRSLTGSLVPSVPMRSYLALLAFYAAVGLAATVLPTRWSLRANPVTAAAHRE
ncbi:MAG: FtsX-like permease family protein [Gaiellaceae bacterium]